MSTVQAASTGTRASTALTRLPRAARRFVEEELTTRKPLLAESFDLAVLVSKQSTFAVFLCYVSLWNFFQLFFFFCHHWICVCV